MNHSNGKAAEFSLPGNDPSLYPHAAEYSARGYNQDTPAGSTRRATQAGTVADLGTSGAGGDLYPHAVSDAAGGDIEDSDSRMAAAAARVQASSQIRAARGWQATIARALKVDRQKVNDVLNGRRTNARVAAAIAGATGIAASQLWPGKYKRLEYFEKVARYEATKAQAASRTGERATGSHE